MLARLRLGKPSPALVISCIALFVALSGSSYAVIVLPKGSVGTKQLRNNAVTGAKIGVDQVTGADVNEATLGQVPSAASAGSANAANTANTASTANTAGDAGLLDGIDSVEFLRNGAAAGGRLGGAYPNPTIPSNSLTGGDISESTLGPVPNATYAGNAGNASSFAGNPESNYLRTDQCRRGSLHGWARILGPAGLGTAYSTLFVAYNCTGGLTQIRRTAEGQYFVRFVGDNTSLLAMGTVLDTDTDHFVVAQRAVDPLDGVFSFRVFVRDADGPTVDSSFTLIVF